MTLYSGDCIEALFSRNAMKSFKNVSIWSDSGKHFKSKEFLARIFESLHFKLKIELKMNFFSEYHGKSLVDGLFGTLTRWLNEAMLEKILNQ